MLLRPCLECGVLSTKPRCPRHAITYSPAERRRMMRAVEDWRMAHGNVCPGFDREPHPSSDLTADHVVPVSRGGHGGRLTILCRSCNGRRGAV